MKPIIISRLVVVDFLKELFNLKSASVKLEYLVCIDLKPTCKKN